MLYLDVLHLEYIKDAISNILSKIRLTSLNYLIIELSKMIKWNDEIILAWKDFEYQKGLWMPMLYFVYYGSATG